MLHTKHALKRHNGPTGWIVIAGLIWIMVSGFIHNRAVDYEADKVEQQR